MPISKAHKTEQEQVCWFTRMIKVMLDDGKTTKKEVKFYGRVAVHECVGNNKFAGWAVTHIGSGLVMTSVKTEADAMRIGAYLWDRACLVMRLETAEEVQERASKQPYKWIGPWCRACRKEGGWVDPAWFVAKAKEQ